MYLVSIIVFNAIHWLFMCCESLQLFHLGYISGKNIFCPHYWMKFNRVDELRTNASLSQRLASPRTLVSNVKNPLKIIFENSFNWLITLMPATVWHNLDMKYVQWPETETVNLLKLVWKNWYFWRVLSIWNHSVLVAPTSASWNEAVKFLRPPWLYW